MNPTPANESNDAPEDRQGIPVEPELHVEPTLEQRLAAARAAIVYEFNEDEVPTFQQGGPDHELLVAVTAERCAELVRLITEHRQTIETLQQRLAEAQRGPRAKPYPPTGVDLTRRLPAEIEIEIDMLEDAHRRLRMFLQTTRGVQATAQQMVGQVAAARDVLRQDMDEATANATFTFSASCLSAAVDAVEWRDGRTDRPPSAAADKLMDHLRC